MLLQALCIISLPLVNLNWNYSPETPNLGQIRRFFNPVTLKFDVWPWKTIGHLFYATSNFAHHFIAIGEFKPEFPSRNAQFGSNSTIFRAVWPWNLTDDIEKQSGTSFMLLQALCIIPLPLVNSNWSSSPEITNSGQNRRFLEPCDLEIWRMTLRNNRAPFLCNFKLCALFRSHWWIQTWNYSPETPNLGRIR